MKIMQAVSVCKAPLPGNHKMNECIPAYGGPVGMTRRAGLFAEIKWIYLTVMTVDKGNFMFFTHAFHVPLLS